jgi:hypothetical protein
MRILKTKKNFRSEFKRQLRYAIAAAVGFMIIYAWRDSILAITKTMVEKFQESTTVASANIISALLISVVGVFIILITSKLLKD